MDAKEVATKLAKNVARAVISEDEAIGVLVKYEHAKSAEEAKEMLAAANDKL